MPPGRRVVFNPRKLDNLLGAAWVTEGSIDTLYVSSSNAKRGSGWSGGGPFFQYSEKWEVVPTTRARRTELKFGYGVQQDMFFVPNTTPLTGGNPTFPATAALFKPSYLGAITTATPYGTKLWRRARPGNPVANLGQFVGELRDIPHIPKVLYRKLKAFKDLGSEYLNVQFGWAPFVRDLQEMYELHQKLDQKLAQLVADNGRGIRRKRTLGETKDVQVTTDNRTNLWTNVWPSPVGPITSFPSSFSRTVTTTEEFWFAGRFRYYVPDIGSSQWTRRATSALYGATPTPSVLWELLPWSWLIDWFGNVGDVISNASSNAVDNLVADYAYVMHKKSVRTELVASAQVPAYPGGASWYPCPAFDATCSSAYTQTKKLRFPATPYGLGVTYSGLSPYKLSILAALGISRANF